MFFPRCRPSVTPQDGGVSFCDLTCRSPSGNGNAQASSLGWRFTPITFPYSIPPYTVPLTSSSISSIFNSPLHFEAYQHRPPEVTSHAVIPILTLKMAMDNHPNQ
ncbi:hypothetical protein BDQ94DRAFT_140135 [Aspergillus welwitschiae]|uniref:Uncharacterized protein n=1 Tax=Aspergillus welwitschiae TaxID=1341132 RepID=A0A3F3Q739_9EURO|nr:hypothetical protein BDQ94DRAFT_140135 [Aspergillus welwitschiae]RDH35034.1 hypothetical protein BDQ94DRAFT_140135 [Aspergillus welwitschiae]